MSANATIVETAKAIRERRTSAMEHVAACLDRMAERNPRINAFRETLDDHAMAQAESIDRRLAAGETVGPLAGVAIAVKDNIVTKFGRTCCGSRMLETYRSPFNATVVQRLIDAGAVIVGKTNCDEFAMGSSTEHCAYGVVRNPWDESRVPGGSSGGSAAAVASGMVPGALGSDTGGSIRQPAGWCGIVGLKPTYGRVSRYGLVAFASSLDVIGPMTLTVADAAALLGAIAGEDRADSTCAPDAAPDYLAGLDQPIQGLRIGVPRQFRSEANDPAVERAVEKSLDVFRASGATVVEIDLPLTDAGLAAYYILAPAEASSNLARFDGIRYGRRAELRQGEELFDLYARSRSEGFGEEVQRRIMLGTYVLSAGYYDAYYKRAMQVRRLIRQEFDAAFALCDVILGPTSPTPAFAIGHMADPLSMYLCDVYTVNTNIAGLPGISVPAGFAEVDGKRLPVGVQLQGRMYGEAMLLRAARMLESALPQPARCSVS